jgi:hypothetical protein
MFTSQQCFRSLFCPLFHKGCSVPQEMHESVWGHGFFMSCDYVSHTYSGRGNPSGAQRRNVGAIMMRIAEAAKLLHLPLLGARAVGLIRTHSDASAAAQYHLNDLDRGSRHSATGRNPGSSEGLRPHSSCVTHQRDGSERLSPREALATLTRCSSDIFSNSRDFHHQFLAGWLTKLHFHLEQSF